MDVLDIIIENISIPPRLRALDPKQVERLAGSIRDIGLKQPISVRLAKSAMTEDGEIIESKPLLVAGRHRLEALKALGRSHAPCIEVTDDDLIAELWEIDENLIRAELSPAQKAQHLARRKELWTAIQSGNTVSGLGGRGNTSFASETATVAGISKQSVNEHIARADALGDDIGKVTGTSLDKGVELDALAKLDTAARSDLIERAQAGEVVTARRLSDYARNEGKAEQLARNALCGAWNRAAPRVRRWFLDLIEAGDASCEPITDWR